MTDAELTDALADVCQAWPALQPPNRVRVSEGAQQLKIARPGGASGFWSPAEAPYMVEPTDMLASRLHQAVCFVGPAQSGKTVALGEGWLTHAVTNDPGDMLIVQMTQDKAREYSKQRIDRAILHSPALDAMRGTNARDDNLHDKQFKNGMWVRIAWPTVSNLSSTSYRYVFLTDYDRMPDDIEGEGDPFSLGVARTRTFLSRGMTAIESSPGRPITDPQWRASTPHEAPPVTGILGVYNRSDRRRWYWQCPHCGEWFEPKPGLGIFGMPSDDELLESIRTLDIDKFSRQYARAVCPHSGCVVQFEHRGRMNAGGRWVQDGQRLDAAGRLHGNARGSSIAGYWLGGAAAAYSTWEALIRKHLQGLLEYALTGSELILQTAVNVDQGAPYMSRHLAEAANGEAPADRAEPELERFIVPPEARYLAASVDVQGGRNARFEVQVHAVGPDQEEWVVDRYAIKHSKRRGIGDEFAPIDPASHPEDWDVLTDRVVKSTYRTSVEGREMRVHMTAVDTGGEDGTTESAYAWWRRLRREGLHQRVMLIKGVGNKGPTLDYFVRETKVGGQQGAGDVPLYLLNSDKLKDIVDAGLRRREAGPGYYHFPKWLPDAFYDELKAEVRSPEGKWSKLRKRNEAFDLCYIIKAIGMRLGVDRREFWHSPPRWALPQDSGKNPEVITSEQRRELKRPRVVVERRVTRSGYL